MPNYRLARPTINGKPTLTWYVVWTEGRRSHRLTTKTTDKVEARIFLERLKAIAAQPPETFTVGDLCRAYLEERDGKVAYHGAIRNSLRHVEAHFGRLPPSMVSRVTVDNYLAQRRRSGVTDATITKELGFLRQALKFGVREKWMADEPKVSVPGSGPARERVLSRDEFAQIYFHASPLHLRVFLGLAIDTLARGKQILALTWDRVDLERGIVFYQPHRPGAKKRTQAAPISDRLDALLRLAFEARGPSGRVVEWNGRPVLSVRKAYERAVRLAGIEDAHRHDLRRSGASWAVQDGVSFSQVAALLGDGLEVTQRHYAHFSPTYLRDVVESIARGSGGKRA